MGEERREIEARLALLGTPGSGPVFVKRLMHSGGSVRACLERGLPSWVKPSSKMHSALGASIRAFRKGAFERPAEKVLETGLHLLMVDDHEYPDRLKSIHAPPQPLWIQGRIELLDRVCISIVGTRRCSDYGRRTTLRLAGELARHGVTIVSGLAEGIDRVAHEGALDGGGNTAAVLGTGPDVTYPRTHRRLQERIGREGALVSEFPMGVQPMRSNFPRRNRLISGLSVATVVVEAFERGGALITARSALDQQRKLFTVPGRVDEPAARGTNLLLKDGAFLVLDTGSIIDVLQSEGLMPPDPTGVGAEAAGNGKGATKVGGSVLPRSQWETEILRLLDQRSLHLDQLAKGFEGPMEQLWGALLRLECDGLVRERPGNRFEAVASRAGS